MRLRSATYRASSRHTAPHCCGHQFACAHPAPQFRISAAAERTTRRSTSRARLVANSPVPRPLLMTSVRESCKFDQSSRGTPILVLSVYRGVPRTLWALMWCRVAGCRSSARTLLLKRVVPLGVACCVQCDCISVYKRGKAAVSALAPGWRWGPARVGCVCDARRHGRSAQSSTHDSAPSRRRGGSVGVTVALMVADALA